MRDEQIFNFIFKIPYHLNSREVRVSGFRIENLSGNPAEKHRISKSQDLFPLVVVVVDTDSALVIRGLGATLA